MRESSWGRAFVMPLVVMSFACGGTAFTSDTDAGSSSGSDSGSSSGSSGAGSSGGTGSSGGSGGGTSSSGGGSSGGSGSGGSGSGGDGGIGSPCPAHEPAPKTSCSQQGLECEFGSNPVQGCDVVATCQGTWQSAAATDSKCSVGAGAGCPLTFEGVPQGSSCLNNGLVCNYARGRCACASSFGGPAMLFDASTAGRWACQDPATPGCPIPRAPLGSACTQNGLSCNYGTCNVPGGTAERCENDLWKPAPMACPVFAAQ